MYGSLKTSHFLSGSIISWLIFGVLLTIVSFTTLECRSGEDVVRGSFKISRILYVND